MTAATAPARRIGTASAVALVVANTVGAGVFTTSGFALADLGSRGLVMAAWAVGGALALCGALSYGALARRIPESGGEYTFLARIAHPLAGFVAGWVSMLAGFTAPIAAAAHALGAYLEGLGPRALDPVWIGTLAIAGAGVLHAVRLQGGIALQNAAVVVKLLAAFAFIALGSAVLSRGAPPAAAPPASFDAGAFAVTLVWISFAYSGWNAAVYIGGEVRDGERELPRALVHGTLLVIVLYLALNAVILWSAPTEALAGVPEVGAVAAEALGGARLRAALSALVALALFTSISSMVMAGPRVYAQMARDGVLPSVLARADEAPRVAIALQVGLAVAVLHSSGLLALLGYIGFTLGLCAAATVLALLALRRREGAASITIPGYPFVPLVFVAGTAFASLFMALREPLQAGLGLLTALAGGPLYYLERRRRRPLR
jgi:APA family basic amino acid/polyamine antiporter